MEFVYLASTLPRLTPSPLQGWKATVTAGSGAGMGRVAGPEVPSSRGTGS